MTKRTKTERAAKPVTPARMRRLLQLTAEASALKQRLKECAMIYQYDEKVRVAKYYGLTFEQVNLPFNEWVVLQKKYHADLDANDGKVHGSPVV